MSALDVVLDRPMPQSGDAERAVLGSLLINNGVAYRIDLTDEEFFKDVNRHVYAAMVYVVFELRQILDGLTLKEELARRGELEMIGGQAYISALMDAVPDVANVERYAAIVRQKAKLRALIVTGNVMMRAALEPDANEQEIAATALAAIGRQATAESAQARHVSDVLDEAVARQQQRQRGEKAALLLRTGIRPLDDCGAIRRAFVLLCSPSEHGKTSFAINLAGALGRNGYRGAFFSLEDDEDTVALRFASSVGRIPHSYLQDFALMNEKWNARLIEAKKAAREHGFFVADKINAIEKIAAECHRLKAMESIDYAIIDYVQIVQLLGVERGMNGETILSTIGKHMHRLSRDLGIMVLSTAQVNEDWKKRGRFIKEDVKGCRSLSEIARVVLFGHRPRALDKTNEKYQWCEMPFQVEKNNNNRTGDFRMHFDEAIQRFGHEGANDVSSTDWQKVCEANDCTRLGNRGPQQKTLVTA